MKVVWEGECCESCFLAANGEEVLLGYEEFLNHKDGICVLVEGVKGHSFHTGSKLWFSWSPCKVCGFDLGGDRYRCFVLGG